MPPYSSGTAGRTGPSCPSARTISYGNVVPLVVLADDRRDHLAGELGARSRRSAACSSLSLKSVHAHWSSAQTGVTPWRRREKWRSLPRAAANRRTSSSRRSSGSTIVSTTSSLASRTMSMSRLVLGALGGDERRPLGLVGDRGDLVGVDGVDGRLGAHHGDLRGGQRDRGVGLEAGAGHRVEARRRTPCAPRRRSSARSPR